MNEVTAPVVANEEVVPGIHVVWVEAPTIARAVQPGEFVMVRGWPRYDPPLRRALSVHRVAGPPGRAPQRLSVMVSAAGRGTGMMARAHPGDQWQMLGPLGKGFHIYPETRRLLLVGGGLGVAPLLFLAERAVAKGLEVTFLLGARTSALLYPTVQLPPEVELVAMTEDGSNGRQGRVTDLLPEYLPWADQVCACGAWGMYASMAQYMNGYDRSVQVLAEVTAMGCGFGICLGCTVETAHGMKLACLDGPRFELRELFPGDRTLTHPLL